VVDPDADQRRGVLQRRRQGGHAGSAGHRRLGNEQIISELGRSFFGPRFWEQSNRGGLHIYEVPIGEWDTASQLDAIPGAPAE
jgi:hypothetical protein